MFENINFLNPISYLYNSTKFVKLFKLIKYLSRNLLPQDEIEVLHRSKNFLLVNKPYDVLINSNNSEDKVTVQNQIKKILPELVNPNLGHDFYFIHRLDYSTSGILCFPLNKTSCQQTARAFQNRNVQKYYLAIVRGHVSKELLEINIGIGEDIRPEYYFKITLEGTLYAHRVRLASTRLLVLEKGISHGYPATKVLLQPLTGRRHQLRLHLNALGHTIAGDFTYSNRQDSETFRMFLHAYRLIIPTSLEHIDVTTADPFSEADPKNKWLGVEKLNELNEQAMKRIQEDAPDIFIRDNWKK